MDRLTLLVLASALSSCTGSVLRWSGGTTGSVTSIREASGEAVLAVGAGPVGSEIYPGELVHVSFLASGARVLETQDALTDGEAVAVPFDAQDAVVALDPPRELGRFGWGGTWTKPTPFSFRALSLVPVDGKYARFVDFRALATSRAQADALALRFLAAPFPSAPPAGVSIGAYAFAARAPQTLVVTLASLSPPTWASLVVDSYSHAGLAGLALEHAGPWWALTFRVPLSALSYRRATGGEVRLEFHELRPDGQVDGSFLVQLAPG